MAYKIALNGMTGNVQMIYPIWWLITAPYDIQEGTLWIIHIRTPQQPSLTLSYYITLTMPNFPSFTVLFYICIAYGTPGRIGYTHPLAHCTQDYVNGNYCFVLGYFEVLCYDLLGKKTNFVNLVSMFFMYVYMASTYMHHTCIWLLSAYFVSPNEVWVIGKIFRSRSSVIIIRSNVLIDHRLI